MWRTIVASVIAHGVVFGVLATSASTPPRTTPPDVAAPVVVLTEPIDVVLTVAVAPAPPPKPSHHVVRVHAVSSRSAVAVSSTASAEPHTDSDGAPPSDEPVAAFDPGSANLTLSPAAAERIASREHAPAESASSSRWTFDPKIVLRPSGGGGHVVRDVVTTVRVAPDGTVDLEDTSHFTSQFDVPNPAKAWRSFKRDMAEWMVDPYKRARVGTTNDLPRHLTAVEGSCSSWTDAMCVTAEDWQRLWKQTDDALAQGKVEVRVRGMADITGYLHEKFVGDPYASRKLKILDQTRDQRAQLGAEYRDDQLDRSAEHVRRNLEVLWRTTKDPIERRAALFTLWDECTEGEGPEGEAGQRARAMVIGWIRAKLPAEHAYSASEVAQLNAARTSRQTFDP